MVFKKGNNPWNKGKKGLYKHSKESLIKIGNSLKGRILSDEWKRKVGLSSKGKTYEERYGVEKAIELKKLRSERMKGIPKTKEAKERMSLAKKGKYCGKNNPAYIDGNTIGSGEKYNYEFTEELKTRIRKRDKFVCQICGRNGYSIHHIDYNKYINSERNLMTLCRHCHGLTGFNRIKWMRFFKK